MWIWLGLGILIGGTVAAVTACLIQRRRETDAWFKHMQEKIRLDLKNMDLLRQIFKLQAELEEERYRHDRVQDFCVKVCDQLDVAKADLKSCGACFTCGKNDLICHAWHPGTAPGIPCGNFRWRGEAEFHRRKDNEDGRNQKRGEAVDGDCHGLRPRNDEECGKQELHWNFPNCKNCKRGSESPCKYAFEHTLYCYCSHYERLPEGADG